MFYGHWGKAVISLDLVHSQLNHFDIFLLHYITLLNHYELLKIIVNVFSVIRSKAPLCSTVNWPIEIYQKRQTVMSLAAEKVEHFE